ncbi:hypothetical protein ACFQ1E_00810 [Sphingomonas canadensis]|uniref:Uncharacterized protein n=1 Tax=Sphingomonas canadensis TaxID=1219257 RepID=A0ABW3H0A1_9SPHN|nr:hypothetical protein [Sphingomonas canadensis]MCW3835219.1 hypothetical protein [Sphingomonas canadensis]
MTISSERLRRMTHYSWHVLRASRERELSAQARDSTTAVLHGVLAELHLDAAEGMAEAWRMLDAQMGAAVVEDPTDRFAPLFRALFEPDSPEAVRALLPPALEAGDESLT